MINFKMKREESKSNMSHKFNKSEKNSTKKLKDFRINLTEWQVEVNSPMLNGSIKSERQKKNINRHYKVLTQNTSIN